MNAKAVSARLVPISKANTRSKTVQPISLRSDMGNGSSANRARANPAAKTSDGPLVLVDRLIHRGLTHECRPLYGDAPRFASLFMTVAGGPCGTIALAWPA